ncbi:PAS domain S-box protein [Sphingomonas sp.]|uniref:PAS domain-containing hybrid sensor histidine kinase/response regulator n=1 Tax=Sphingomonas sp. TaxID=28214 RepID=UPI002DED0D55|nr:PAS domain S-box protein [Sphingomonas sp.]
MAKAGAPVGNSRDAADSRLEIVLDSMADSHVLVDADWRVTIVNRAAEQFFGLDREAMRGRSLWDLFPSARGTAFQTNFERALAGETVRFETASALFQGVVVAVRAAPLPDGGLSIAFDDITDRKRGEAAVRESEARFRLIADSAPVPMWVTSLDRKRWFVNRAYVEFLGVSYEEAVDFDWRTIIHPDDLPRIMREQVEKEASLEPFDLEARYRKADGSWCWIRSHSQPRWGPDGEHVGFIGVAFDVTIAKEAELELQRQVAERTADLEALYNETPTILHSANADQRLISVSDRWLEFMGYDSRDEVLGRRLTEFMTPESIARLGTDTWPRLMRDGFYNDAEYQVVKKSGEIADIIASTRVRYDEQGRFARTMAALIDITGRKRTEEALRQAQKVEAMGQLTGGVAHDFNNLLSPIIGGLDLLQRRGVGDERDRRTIAGALQAAERAKTLVQRLLAFARRQPLQPAPVDASKLIEGMAELIASTAGPRVRVVVDTPDGLPPCLADPNQVEMALLNLSVNARDAMPDGGVLTISAAEAQADKADDLAGGRYVKLTVTDTGLGMDEETLARAIEPFFSTKGIGRGTGLGLSMVHGLAAQLNGALRLRSAPGEGTEVQLWLPCAASAARVAEDSRPAATVSAQGVVLLVDDEALVRNSTAEMLADMGFRVVEYESAERAIRYLAEGGAADLIVTDHLMPGMTGVELARAARQLRPGTPTLLISGYAELSGLDADVPRLTKPFRHADLASMIGAVMG